MVRGLYGQPIKAAFNKYWQLMKVVIGTVLDLMCFLDYFEPTYVTKVDGHRGIHHSPDTWATYAYLPFAMHSEVIGNHSIFIS